MVVRLRAGTSSDYRGLFSTVADFVRPSDAELASAGDGFPERAEPPPLVGWVERPGVDPRGSRRQVLARNGRDLIGDRRRRKIGVFVDRETRCGH